MEPGRFAATAFGAPSREAGNRWAFWYYKAAPLPRRLELTSATILALSEADAALGQLQGLGRLLPDPELLLVPYLTREAVASTRIEGTQTSLSEVLKSEASEAPGRNDDVDEVLRYVAATRLGLRLIETLPITARLVKQVHKELLSGVRGAERRPGELRTTPVWVGSPTDTPDTATYVPPLPDDVADLFSDWEHFVNDSPPMPALIQCALTHYQFETIHPFLDGNGRIGRLLIGLQLVQQRKLTTPLLYVSGYLELHRRDYYDRLQAVRERGEIQEWLQFFLTAVRRQCEDAIHRADQLIALRDAYATEAATTRSNLPGLVTIIFRNPYLTVSLVQHRLGMTNQGARYLIKEAERRGWLRPVDGGGRGSKSYWVAEHVLDVIEAPAAYIQPAGGGSV